MSGAKILASVLSLLVVLAVVYFETGGRGSPGPLHPSHARVSGLVGSCETCHGEGGETLASSCLQCHEDLAAQLESRRGLHGALNPAEAERCGRCHAEHGGSLVALVHDLSFQNAGVPNPAAYAHEHVADFVLSGRHAELACAECHEHAHAAALVEGQKRYLGLAQDCRTCHEDVHEGRLGTDCATCHGQSGDFARAGGFEHTQDFPLTDAHAKPACRDCHERGGAYDFEQLRERTHRAVRDCAACHENPHEDPNSSVLQLASAGDCARCHDRVRFGGATFDVAAHARIGVDLLGAHLRLDCLDCHRGSRTPRDAPRKMERCGGCHSDVHARRMHKPHFADAGDCSQCHDQESFARASLSGFSHAQTGFELRGRHRDVACEKCHDATGPVTGRPEPGTSRFRSAECARCHESPHRTDFVTKVAELRALPVAQACSICHQEKDSGWVRPHARLPEDLHAASGFVLEHGHAEPSCVACHEAEKGVPYERRFPGRGADSCQSCHADVHAGQFGPPGDPPGACKRCHDTRAFGPSTFDLDRHRDTRLPLTGSHQAVPCEKCHVAPRTPRGAPRRYRGTPSLCSRCHDDVHAGRFDRPGLPKRVEGRTDCARCHQTSSFREFVTVDFDHGAWTTFALKGAHSKVKCAQCHAPRKPGQKYALPDVACASCHEDVHAGQFRDPKGRTDCGRCHDSEPGWTARGFDHARDARFELDRTHRKLSCSACHRPVRHEGRSVVRYRPLGRKCADCHANWSEGRK